MQNLKVNNDNLANALYEYIIQRVSCNESKRKMLDKISAAIGYAWEQWDEELLVSYFDPHGDGIAKPELPTNEFILNWLENEDFAADGYNMDYLKELFCKS